MARALPRPLGAGEVRLAIPVRTESRFRNSGSPPGRSEPHACDAHC